MSLVTLKTKVEQLIEKAQSAGGEIDIEQYNYLTAYYQRSLTGHIIYPEWARMGDGLEIFANQPNVTVFETGHITRLSGISWCASIHGLVNLEKIVFNKVTHFGGMTLYGSGSATPNSMLNKLHTVEFKAIATFMSSSWLSISAPALTNIIIPQGWNCAFYASVPKNLTSECLHAIIENLADLTGSKAQAFTIGSQNLARVDEEHIAMLNAKNWNYS